MVLVDEDSCVSPFLSEAHEVSVVVPVRIAIQDGFVWSDVWELLIEFVDVDPLAELEGRDNHSCYFYWPLDTLATSSVEWYTPGEGAPDETPSSLVTQRSGRLRRRCHRRIPLRSSRV